MGGDKRPAFQFYPGDWSTDIDLHRCSLAAQGLWIKMMCLMHHGEPYGHLQTGGGGIISTCELARLAGATVVEVAGCLAELNERGVYSITSAGAIYSRRMVLDAKDHAAYRSRAAAGGRASAASRWGTEFDDDGNRVVTSPVTRPVTKSQPAVTIPVTEKSKSPSPSPSPSPKKERTALGAENAWGLNWIIDTWNDTADRCGLSKIRVMNDHRCRVATRRINEHGGVEMRLALEAPRCSKYLCGLLPDKPWKVTFDWLMKQENMLKILEGNFRDSKRVVPAHMQVGAGGDTYPWHPDDVNEFSGSGEWKEHPRWNEYYEACEAKLGLDADAWPRFEKWINANPSVDGGAGPKEKEAT